MRFYFSFRQLNFVEEFFNIPSFSVINKVNKKKKKYNNAINQMIKKIMEKRDLRSFKLMNIYFQYYFVEIIFDKIINSCNNRKA